MPTKMSAMSGPNGLPIATPCICQYIQLLKLKETDFVELMEMVTKTTSGKDGGFTGPRYKNSAQISMVFVKLDICEQTRYIKQHEMLSVRSGLQFVHICSKLERVRHITLNRKLLLDQEPQ